MRQQKGGVGRWWLRVAFGVVVLLGCLSLLRQAKELGASLAIVRQADWRWIVVAFGLVLASNAWAAAVYRLLGRATLKLWPTVLVQLATNFTNRLLPSGIGALALNYRYLRQHRHTAAAAAAIVSLNNSIGFIANSVLLLLMAAASPRSLKQVHGRHVPALAVAGMTALVLLAACLLYAGYRRRLRTFALQAVAQIRSYSAQPYRLAAALACAALLTVCLALALWAAARACHVHLSLPVSLLVLSLSVLGATVTPTPGGIGGAEVAMAASLAVYGLPLASAVSVTALYRLLTFWVMLGIGAAAYPLIRRRRYI